MKICEIFLSIQGESTFVGRPSVFVRLTGCNLRCAYCDTTYAYDEGAEMSEDEIVEAVKGYGIGLVEVTGGEPLMQAGATTLIKRLLDEGFRVLVETNGSMNIAKVDPRATIIMDVKTPGSEMSESLTFQNIDRLKPSDEVKFVITDRRDYEWARGFIMARRLSECCPVLFSPCFGLMSAQSLARWILEDRLDVRLNLQLHKYLYGPDARGV